MRRVPGRVPKADITAVVVALDERDRSTDEHCGRVAGLALELGYRCGLNSRELRQLALTARLHDVGKIGIPDDILLKTSPFSDEDWTIMRTHSVRGQRVIDAAGLEDGDMIGLGTRHHHERFDGDGYPDGLKGEAIPFLARMVAIGDAYDAMANLRPYRPGRSHTQIMAVLFEQQGRQHDPYLVKQFAHIIGSSKFRVS